MTVIVDILTNNMTTIMTIMQTMPGGLQGSPGQDGPHILLGAHLHLLQLRGCLLRLGPADAALDQDAQVQSQRLDNDKYNDNATKTKTKTMTMTKLRRFNASSLARKVSRWMSRKSTSGRRGPSLLSCNICGEEFLFCFLLC